MAHSRWDVQRDSYDRFVISSSAFTDRCICKHCQTVLVRVWWAEPRLPQESLRQKAERIEELEEALRESVQITAEREMVLVQEEAARTHQEKQVNTTRLTISESTCDSLTIRCISKNHDMPPWCSWHKMLKITVSCDAVVKDVCLYVFVAIKGIHLKTQLLREWFTVKTV